MGKKKKPPEPPKRHPLDIVRRAVDSGVRHVVVSVSGGKDATATLDVCCEHFERVSGFFMYYVKDLSFQERYLRYLEKRYQIELLRVPHWNLTTLFRNCTFRHGTKQALRIRQVKVRDIEAFVRKKFGADWVCTGEKCRDSIERNTQITQCNGINPERHRIWPIGWWTHSDVFSHLARKQIMMPPDYRLDFSGRGQGMNLTWASNVAGIADNFPEDYQKILKVFPLLEAQVQRFRQMQARKKESDPDGEEKGTD